MSTHIQYKVAVVQAAPVYLDLDRTLDKAIDYIAQAARAGARLVAFGETWVPGYPFWIWLSNPAEGIPFVARYHANSLAVDSAAFRRVCAAAAEHGIWVSLGASERAGGSLYIAQFLIDAHGKLVRARRKLKPTHVERTVFGEGDGSSIAVDDTELGRVGGLCCWEHLQPLTKYAMYSLHEQVHVGCWPAFSLYPQAYSLSGPMNNAVSSVYAAEGQCYFLAPCSVITPEVVAMVADTDAKRALIVPGGGHAMIFGPDGRPLCEPLPETAEGLLYADLDLDAIRIAKSFADPVGHYSRPDVTRLLLNREPAPPVQVFSRTMHVVTGSDAPVDDGPLSGAA